MIRFVLPVILVGIGVVVFFTFSSPIYNDIIQLRVQAASYNDALSNSKALEIERDKLTTKDNSIKPEDKIKLQKLLPENIDNIRLILEIEQIALPYGMVLKDVKYNVTPADTAKGTTGGEVATVQGGATISENLKDYGVWDLEFSSTGTYGNFLNFIRDLEKNLRIVDISSIQFSSDTTAGANNVTGGATSTTTSPLLESYKYGFKIKTYWLKN